MICRILSIMGYPVFYSDTYAREISQNDIGLRAQIQNAFGKEAYTDAGFNRTYISQLVFNNPEKLQQLNGLIHPLVRKGFVQWASKQKAPVVFNEAAILFETGSYHNMDKNILVVSPLDLRLKRLGKRDQASPAELQARMNNQWPDESKIPLADYVIQNDDYHALIPQIQHILFNLKT